MSKEELLTPKKAHEEQPQIPITSITLAARQKKLKTSKINGNYYFTRTAWNEYLGIETNDERLKKDLEIAELKGKIKSLETQIQAFKSVASSLNHIIEM
ncbi:helix-turn-helix domain-containing protein [Clostridium beijerinckii]|uniref:DNA-binding protein n=1 Tax=Clostridium beijerinckii TaxID=1520 RepID=UPI001FAD2296|nr:DNA-binding protein [Clostridium beijerinckii]